MNRQLRFEAAYEAVAQALLTGATFKESELLAIATEQLTERSAFLAKQALERCILTSAGKIGPDIMIIDDCEITSESSFRYIGG